MTSYILIRGNFRIWGEILFCDNNNGNKTHEKTAAVFECLPNFRTYAISLHVLFLYLMPTRCGKFIPFSF